MKQISDFKIPFNIIRLACVANKVSFVDLKVQFSTGQQTVLNGVVLINQPKNTSALYWSIINTYLSHFQTIYGIKAFSSDKQKVQTLSSIHSFLGTLFIKNIPDGWKIQKADLQRLHQYPLVWIIMRDILCPINQILPNNSYIVHGQFPQADISMFIQKQKLKQQYYERFKDGVIIVNEDISYQPIQLAYILYSAIQSHKLSSQKVINNILTNKFILDKIHGAARIYFIDQRQINDFMSTLSTISNHKNDIQQMINSTKTAQGHPQTILNMSKMMNTQSTQSLMGNFWYAGILQRMLQPHRHAHPQVFFSLQKMRNVIWDKVIQARKQAGADGLSYQALNQLKNKQRKTTQDYAVLQKMLSSKRIW